MPDMTITATIMKDTITKAHEHEHEHEHEHASAMATTMPVYDR